MNNLKTLNDLTLNGKEGHPHFHKIYCGDDLRAEAIKWIKELKKESFITNPKLTNELLTQTKVSTIVWIKHFFNIMDEELK